MFAPAQQGYPALREGKQTGAKEGTALPEDEVRRQAAKGEWNEHNWRPCFGLALLRRPPVVKAAHLGEHCLSSNTAQCLSRAFQAASRRFTPFSHVACIMLGHNANIFCQRDCIKCYFIFSIGIVRDRLVSWGCRFFAFPCPRMQMK
jgi:hypothetical protein